MLKLTTVAISFFISIAAFAIKPVTYDVSMSLDVKGEKISFPKFKISDGAEKIVVGKNGVEAKIKVLRDADEEIQMIRFFAKVTRKTAEGKKSILSPEIIALEGEEAFAAVYDKEGRSTELKFLASRTR